jgi:hypothetical protein
MAWRSRLLVVANQTATSDELHAFLARRRAEGPVDVTLLLAAERNGAAATELAAARLAEALTRMDDAGIVCVGVFADADPFVAACEAYHPDAFDEIVVSTLPVGSSRWLAVNTPQRIQHATGARVTHVTPDSRPVQFA